MPVIDRIPLQRSVAVITEDQIIVRPSRAQLVAPMVQAAIAAAAVAVIVVLFDRVPLWLLMLSLAVALLFGPASILGIVYQIYGSSFVVERHKQSARWQQGLLGLGLGTRDLVPFGRIDYIEVRGDQDDELTSGERHDLVQWDVRLVKDNGRALEIGAFAAARPLAADALGRANRLAEHIGEMTGHEARTLPPLEADGAAPVADGPPGRRRRRLARRPAAPPPPGELDVVTLDGPDRPLELMAAAESIAVVGIASDPGRPSNDVCALPESRPATACTWSTRRRAGRSSACRSTTACAACRSPSTSSTSSAARSTCQRSWRMRSRRTRRRSGCSSTSSTSRPRSGRVPAASGGGDGPLHEDRAPTAAADRWRRRAA